MNKKLSTTILSAAVVCGGLVGAGGLVANAYDTEDPTTPTTAVESETDTDTDADAGEVTPVAPNGLVAQVEGEPPAPGAEGERPEGRRGGGCGGNEAVADVLGLTTDELHEAREAGSSLADVAASQGVAVDAVVQAIIDDKTERLDERLASGEITQAEAEERIADIEARATEKVNSVRGE